MPYAQMKIGVPLYYELTGPEDGPVILQFGGRWSSSRTSGTRIASSVRPTPSGS
jgi:hypothetical protein